MLDTYLVIGEILKPQGVKGEIKIRPITCDVGRFEGLENIFLKRGEVYERRGARVTRIEQDAVYMFLNGVHDRNDAEALRGELIYVDRAHAVALPDDAEFICDLVGCEAADDSGRTIGKLTQVLQPGGNDVYVFSGPLGEVLVPALKSVVLKVDVENKTMLLSAARLEEVAVFDED